MKARQRERKSDSQESSSIGRQPELYFSKPENLAALIIPAPSSI
jgi:hypothetical protein